MMRPRQAEQGALFYNFSLDAHVPADHLLRSIDGFVDFGGAAGARAVLQLRGTPVGRSGVDDPDADCRLLFRYSLGAPPLRGGASEPGLPLVLPAGAGGAGSRSFDLLQEPARS